VVELGAVPVRKQRGDHSCLASQGGYLVSMRNPLQALRRLKQEEPSRGGRTQRRPRRRDPDFVGRSKRKDIEQAPPGRAQELAGHAVERVDT
jgi:hypothetical protein